MAKNQINGNDVVSSLENQAAEIKQSAKKEVIKLANGWTVYPIAGGLNTYNGIPSGVGVVVESDKGTVFVPNSKVVKITDDKGTFKRWEVMSTQMTDKGGRLIPTLDIIVE